VGSSEEGWWCGPTADMRGLRIPSYINEHDGVRELYELAFLFFFFLSFFLSFQWLDSLRGSKPPL
jgi:hypothetical protein